MSLIKAHIAEPSLAQLQTALSSATSHLLSKGVTTVGDMGRSPFAAEEASWQDLEELLDPAAAAGQLGIR